MRKFKRVGKFCAYIVECRDGTYYTGYTNDLENRLKEHNSGKRGAKYTRNRRPVKLVWRKEYRQFRNAVITEKRIKNLTRKQKEGLVNGKRLDKVLLEAAKRKIMPDQRRYSAARHDTQMSSYLSEDIWVADGCGIVRLWRNWRRR